MMTTESRIEILRAHLARRGIHLSDASGTLMLGKSETTALREIAELLEDVDVSEFDDAPTKPIPKSLLMNLQAATSAVLR